MTIRGKPLESIALSTVHPPATPFSIRLSQLEWYGFPVHALMEQWRLTRFLSQSMFYAADRLGGHVTLHGVRKGMHDRFFSSVASPSPAESVPCLSDAASPSAPSFRVREVDALRLLHVSSELATDKCSCGIWTCCMLFRPLAWLSRTTRLPQCTPK